MLGKTIYCDIQAYYADTGEEINMAGSSSWWWNEPFNNETYHYFSHRMPLDHIDISRDIEFRIDRFDEVSANEMTNGLEFVVNASPNVDTKIMANENGAEFELSTLGAIHILSENEDYPDEIKKVSLIKSDGSYKDFHEWGWSCGEMGNIKVISISFREMFDISDVIGIKIDDDIYMAADE